MAADVVPAAPRVLAPISANVPAAKDSTGAVPATAPGGNGGVGEQGGARGEEATGDEEAAGGEAAALVGGGGDEDAGGSEDASAAPTGTRPLVVLDLNGVLVERRPYGSRSPRGGGGGGGGGGSGQDAYVRRPHCEAFLDFCFRTFDVAVWSCGKLQNMELGLFQGRTLAAVLHQVPSASAYSVFQTALLTI